MEQIIFTCTVENNYDCEDLGIEFWLDSNKFHDSNVKNGQTPIKFSFDEDETEHSLKIVLKNKTIDHTKVNEAGEIESDILVSVKDISFDDINIDQLFYAHAVYTHDYNGSGNTIKDEFYGELGCNGTLELKFSTPFYLWLLEHM